MASAVLLEQPFDRMVRWRTVAKVLSMGLVSPQELAWRRLPWRCRASTASRDDKPIAISNWRERRGRSSGSCEQARAYNKRGRQAGGVSIPGRKAPTWLSGNKYGVASNLSSHSIGCALPSLNRLTIIWFRIVGGVKMAEKDDEYRGSCIVGQTKGREHDRSILALSHRSRCPAGASGARVSALRARRGGGCETLS